jgi:hypothetical protein
MFSQGAGQATAGSAAAQAHSDVGAVRLRQGLEGRLSHRSGIGGTPFLKAVRFEKLQKPEEEWSRLERRRMLELIERLSPENS